jgi:hypothetical protein
MQHPLHLQWCKDNPLPARRKPPPRHINPKLCDAAQKEMERMRGYVFDDSISPIVSALVMAYKKTEPFIRIYNDHAWIRPYIDSLHNEMPNVKQSLEKMIKYR